VLLQNARRGPDSLATVLPLVSSCASDLLQSRHYHPHTNGSQHNHARYSGYAVFCRLLCLRGYAGADMWQTASSRNPMLPCSSTLTVSTGITDNRVVDCGKAACEFSCKHRDTARAQSASGCSLSLTGKGRTPSVRGATQMATDG
jgi:hypothetical protein